MNVMDCREYRERIVLFHYEELTEQEQTELETHLQACSTCNESFEQEKSLHAVLAEDSDPWNVPSDLLVESRRALANELDRIEGRRGWWRLPAFSVVFTPMRLLEWTTLVAVGLAAGVYLNTSFLHRESTPGPSSASLPTISGSETESISNLRIVSSDLNSGNVELVGDIVRPLHFQGNLQDSLAQQLLVGALRDGRNPSSRISAVEALSRKPDNRQIREALIRSLEEDDNPGVRLKALQTLKPYAAQEDVRAAIMNTLANDEDAGIRVQAIGALSRFAKDDSVAKAVQEVTKNDENAWVKIQAIQFVGKGQ
ncbi:MAG TPA: HEAT repeat domain-containing protein [Terriglobia bacterium]|nr:HEAT repeat domain-containing protein [Terriglobia bacterium]